MLQVVHMIIEVSDERKDRRTARLTMLPVVVVVIYSSKKSYERTSKI
jgi:hypothetical protein